LSAPEESILALLYMQEYIVSKFCTPTTVTAGVMMLLVVVSSSLQTVPYSAELQDNFTTILSAKIVGVAALEKQ